jgi:hypothetical protein
MSKLLIGGVFVVLASPVMAEQRIPCPAAAAEARTISDLGEVLNKLESVARYGVDNEEGRRNVMEQFNYHGAQYRAELAKCEAARGGK